MSAVQSLEDLSARNNGKKDKIVVEKVEAEELLPGWTKEVKVRKAGSRTKTDRYYTDPVTGYTFRSLKDVQRYLKTGEVGKLAIKPKDNSCVDMDIEDEKLHMARLQNSSLVETKSDENFVESTTTEDRRFVSENASEPCKKIMESSNVNLPEAIGLKEREEESESKEQMMVTSPLSETSRHKRPLEDGSEGHRMGSKSRETSKSELPQRASKRLAGIKVDASTPSLPEPKTRQATRLAGIKIDAPPPSLSEPKTRQATQLAGVKIDALPPSLPEPKTRQATQLAGIKIDAPPPSPPEPKTRQAIQLAGIKIDAPPPSPPEPKTRQATQLAGIKIDASPPSPPEPKTRQATRLAGIKIDAPPPSVPEPKTRQATRLAGIKIDAPPPSPPEPKTRQVTRLAGIEVDASAPSPPEPKTRQATRLAGIKVDASLQSPPQPKTRQATRLAGKEIDASPPSLPEPKTRQATRLAGIRVDASPPSLPEPKTRQATRLAGIKIDSPPSSPPEPKTRCQATERRLRQAETRTTVNLAIPKESNKKAEVEKNTSCGMQADPIASSEVRLSTPVECVREVTEKHDENADMDNKPNRKQEISILLPPASQESLEKVNEDGFNHIVLPPVTPSASKEHYKEIEMGPTTLPPVGHTTPQKQAPPTVVPPTNLGTKMEDKPHEKQELPAINPPVNNSIQQDNYGGDIKPGSMASFSLNDLWTDPCIEFAVKTLTGAIPFGDLNKADNFPASPLEVPLEELWTDPCIEFAVKTLTGAIPVGEDLCVQDYLQHQPTSSSETRREHSFSLPDVGTNNFCQTDVLSKHFETAHNKQQDSVVPTLGNGVLPKSGTSVLPQQVTGSNGQCSRTRFFQ